MKYFNKIIISFLLIFIVNQKAFSQAGTPDLSFGESGVVILDAYSFGDASLPLSDGKTLVMGGGLTEPVIIWRFNIDGSLDQSFGINGRIGYSFERALTEIHGIKQQVDGKILITMEYNSPMGGIDASVLRFKYDGSLDSSFGIDGFDSAHISSYNYPSGIVVQNDGKIVIAGQAENVVGVPKSAFLARFMPNGGLDPSFGTDGIVITYYSGKTPIVDLAIRPDGKILTGGTFGGTGFHPSYQVESYNTDGSVDESFGVNGIARYIFGEGQSGQ